MIILYGASNYCLNKNRKEDKNLKICLFSGGFDSTYMLYRLFSEGDDKVLIISAIPDKGYSGEKNEDDAIVVSAPYYGKQ